MHAKWQDFEFELIKDLADYYPLPLLVEQYQKIAKERGWTHRTYRSIETKFYHDLGLHSKPKLDNFPKKELADILGVSTCQVDRWIASGLRVVRVHSHKMAISLRSFRGWAHKHPNLLMHCDRDGLQWLMNDKDFVGSIPYKLNLKVVLKRLDTGREFKSIEEAAKASFALPGTIRRRMRRALLAGEARFESCGYYWEIPELARKQGLPPWESIDERVSLRELSKLLGYSSHHWTDKCLRYGIPVRREGSWWRLSIREFQGWARQHPQLFVTIDPAKLASLGMDELFLQQVDRIKRSQTKSTAN